MMGKRILLRIGISKALYELRFTPHHSFPLWQVASIAAFESQSCNFLLSLCDTVSASSVSSGILLTLPIPDFHSCFYSSFCCFTVLCSFCISPLSTQLKVCWRPYLLLKLFRVSLTSRTDWKNSQLQNYCWCSNGNTYHYETRLTYNAIDL